MTLRSFAPRSRRALAAGAIVLSLGGLVLLRAPGATSPIAIAAPGPAHGVSFSGPGASGTFALSHGAVVTDGSQRVFAQLTVDADDTAAVAARAPLSLVVLLDTSGSMDGDKLAEARRSVIALLGRMDDDDEIALVRYDMAAEVIQPMARLGDVRADLSRRLQRLDASGGTNIPAAMGLAQEQMRWASSGRVRRVVLVSDGLDANESQADALASRLTDGGATVSSLGIGLDFDEGYLAGVARAGRGNFGFVRDARTLHAFLERELDETASTTVDQVLATVALPRGMRLVRAVGADVVGRDGGRVTLRVGSLHAGAERRVALELAVENAPSGPLIIASDVSWQRVGGDRVQIGLDPLVLDTTDDAAVMVASRDGAIFGSAVSAFASVRQLEAAEAYAAGDADRALQLIDENTRALEDAAAAAPPAVAERIAAQKGSYDDARSRFRGTAPGSGEGRAAAKREFEKNNAHLARPSF